LSGRNKYQNFSSNSSRPKLKFRKATRAEKIMLGFAFSLLIVVVVWGLTQNNHIKADQDGYIAAKLIKVIDSNNIKVQIAEKEETVKLLLVDAPDSHENMPFSQETTEFLKQSLEGKEIKLEQDAVLRGAERKLPMYVYADGVMLNEMLLENGLARVVESTDNVKHIAKFLEIQNAAKENKVGIWSIDNFVTNQGFDKHAQEKNEKAAALAEAKAKAEAEAAAAVEAAKKKQPAKNVYYANCSAVKAAGKAPLYRDEPGYRSALDRDNDGVACE